MAERLYVITNSHLDPIWIWRRRSGRSAWINTAHSVVRMMKKYPELKFTCSASAMYRWIEENEPALFRDITMLVREGRWEVTGGWEVQSDTIISETEPLLRQAQVGKAYFREKFGVDVNVGYSVDAFGHSAGLPKILNASGIQYYAATRPEPHCLQLPLLFDWKSDDGSKVRYVRILESYQTSMLLDRETFHAHVDKHFASPLKYQTLFFGVGDHGGGIYEKQLGWLLEEMKQRDIVFSTLQEYFDAVKDERVPVITGELGNVFKGCYSACHEVKRQIAYGLDRILTAEKFGAGAEILQEPWKELLFNHFHDILPGTSLREACQADIYPGLGSVAHAADVFIDHALCRKAAAADTSFMEEGGVMVCNREDCTVVSPVSVTGFTDPNFHGERFNALKTRSGKVYPLQLLPPPTTFGPCIAPWADMTTVVKLSPHEELFLAYARVPEQQLPKIGFDRQRKLLEQLEFLLFHDDSGTWGFTMTPFLHCEKKAELAAVEEIADGPVCSILRATYRAGTSEIRADIWHMKNIPELRLKIRLNWHEERTVLKMAYYPGFDDFTMATGVPGQSLIRAENLRAGGRDIYENAMYGGFSLITQEFPMIQWCGVFAPKTGESAAFFCRDLHSCDFGRGALRLTLLRTALYADHHPFPRNEQTGYQDVGMTFLEVFLNEENGLDESTFPKQAQKCLNPAEVLEVTCHAPDPLAAKGETCPFVNELPCVITESVRKNSEGKWEVQLLNHGEQAELVLPLSEKIVIPAKGLKKVSVQ